MVNLIFRNAYKWNSFWWNLILKIWTKKKSATILFLLPSSPSLPYHDIDFINLHRFCGHLHIQYRILSVCACTYSAWKVQYTTFISNYMKNVISHERICKVIYFILVTMYFLLFFCVKYYVNFIKKLDTIYICIYIYRIIIVRNDNKNGKRNTHVVFKMA